MGVNRRWRLTARRSVRAAVCVCLALGSLSAHALVPPRPDAVRSDYWNGRTTVSGSAANGHWNSTVSGSGIKLSTSGAVNAPGGRSAVVGTSKTITGLAARKYLFRALPYIGTGLLLYELWESYGVTPAGHDPGTSVDEGTCTYAWSSGGSYPNLAGAVAEAVASVPGGTGVGFWCVELSGTCFATRGPPTCSGSSDAARPFVSTPGGTVAASGNVNVSGTPGVPCDVPVRTGDGRCPTGVHSPITEDAAAALIAGEPLANIATYVDQALDYLPLPLEAPLQVESPVPTVEGPTTTTTGPGGTTTTETEWDGEVPSTEPDTIDWDETTTTTGPDGTETVESTDPLDDGPPEQKDHCVDNPGRIGCMEAGEPDDVEVPNQDINVAITPVSFGATDAACPAAAPIVTSHGTYNFEYDGMCMVAQGIRPVVIAMAWLAAGFILLGFNRSED